MKSPKFICCGFQNIDDEDFLRRVDSYGGGRIGNNSIRTGGIADLIARPGHIGLVKGHMTRMLRLLRRIRGRVFWIDESLNPEAGWEWCDVATVVSDSWRQYTVNAKERFCSRVTNILQEGFNKAYIFGTGPSLALASRRDWSDGIRIVCNTIVRDKQLFDTIRPHFIVAGDGIYHFGYTPHARAFRQDLAARMAESDAYFVLPERFLPMVVDELSSVMERVIPIPIGAGSSIHTDLTMSFQLPGLPNVLNLLLLPLGCTLSKRVCLWGFDGRAPKDEFFWANSSKQSYPELMEGLRTAHPAFFREQVPDKNPEKYVKAVHGDLLESILADAEGRGWEFKMMHKTWTPTLAKRYIEEGV